VRKLSALPDPGLVERVAREVLSERPIEILAELLSTVGRMAQEERVRAVYMGIMRLCLSPAEEDELPLHVREEVYSILAARGEGALVRYLLHLPPVRTYNDRDEAYDPVLDDMSLGMKKWQARLHDRNLLLRLGRDGDAAVVSNVLNNPRITEDDVLLMAARRPVHQRTIMVIARHLRWSLRPRIQEAVARNPYSPAHAAAALMPLLVSRLLTRIRDDANLHHLVREAALEVLALRRVRREAHDNSL